MKKRRLLFVCGSNLDSSSTAENVFERVKGFEAKSTGVSFDAAIPMAKELMEWADAIYVMGKKNQEAALKIAPLLGRKIQVFDIPDIYYGNQPELNKVLTETFGKLDVKQTPER